MQLPSVLIVSPYAASANNGNARTASRWADLLRPDHRVILRTTEDPLADADVLVALHARRSHAVVRAWRARSARRPCLVVLTGTDLYHDLPAGNDDARDSLALADGLVVLQARGVDALPLDARAKASVVYQSAQSQPPFAKTSRRLRVLFVGHVRPEKDPLTFVRAASQLAQRADIEFAMIGGSRDPAMAAALLAARAQAPRLQMLGALSHPKTLQHIRRAHLLVVPSRMEGGANVIVEAVLAATPVIASDCDGNVGMLGEGYPGYFAVGEHAQLAALIVRCRDDASVLRRLSVECAARAPLFFPQAERSALLAALSRCGLRRADQSADTRLPD